MIEQVKIGGQRYSVRLVEDLHTIDDENKKKSFYGQVEYKPGVIRLEENTTPDQQGSTIIHEIMHVLLEHAADGNDIEKQLVILGYGLYQVFRDNPQLVALIVE